MNCNVFFPHSTLCQHINHSVKVILPCNDSDFGKEGAHWSLIIVDMKDRVAHHLDSLQGFGNRKIARQFCCDLSKDLRLQFRYDEVDCFKQRGSSMDCGIHVIVNCMRFIRSAKTNVKQLFSGTKVRQEIMKYIENGKLVIMLMIMIFFLNFIFQN